jgi:hypothetical protein
MLNVMYGFCYIHFTSLQCNFMFGEEEQVYRIYLYRSVYSFGSIVPDISHNTVSSLMNWPISSSVAYLKNLPFVSTANFVSHTHIQLYQLILKRNAKYRYGEALPNMHNIKWK